MATAKYKRYFLGKEYRENQEPARAYILRGAAYSEDEYWYPKDKQLTDKASLENLRGRLKSLLKNNKS